MSISSYIISGNLRILIQAKNRKGFFGWFWVFLQFLEVSKNSFRVYTLGYYWPSFLVYAENLLTSRNGIESILQTFLLFLYVHIPLVSSPGVCILHLLMTTGFISLQLYSNLVYPKQVPAFFSASASPNLLSSFLYVNNQVSLFQLCMPEPLKLSLTFFFLPRLIQPNCKSCQLCC